MKKTFLASSLMMGILFTTTVSYSLILDLTTIPSSGMINGAIFKTPPSIVSGTGLIDPFVRIQAKGDEEGYNTDNSSLPYDEKPGIWTHSLQLSDIQGAVTNIGGIDYYEFVLDINQTGSSSFLSMHEFQLYLHDNGSENTAVGSFGSLIYDLDAGSDSQVDLDYNNFPGSGKLDMFALIPTSLFGTDLTKYIYLYSAFGDRTNPSNAGFEEWAYKLEGTFTPPGNPVPEPATMLLFGAGLVGLAGIRRKGKK